LRLAEDTLIAAAIPEAGWGYALFFLKYTPDSPASVRVVRRF
jgi:hypothetical protein